MRNPIQPIEDGRFKTNKIVEHLLDNGGIDMNDLAILSFTQDDRVQFAQLIGYSVSGFSTLSYVDDETYATICEQQGTSISEQEARLEALRSQIEEMQKGLKIAACAAFRIHEDDLVI